MAEMMAVMMSAYNPSSGDTSSFIDFFAFAFKASRLRLHRGWSHEMADACHSCVLVRPPSRESPVTTTERVRLVYAWRGSRCRSPDRNWKVSQGPYHACPEPALRLAERSLGRPFDGFICRCRAAPVDHLPMRPIGGHISAGRSSFGWCYRHPL